MTAKAVTGRVVRLADIFHQRFAEAFRTVGVSDGVYGVLAALRLAGDPYRLTPSELTKSLMVTSGGMTAIIDRLEQQGYVERMPNPTDRRGVLVGLTAAGATLADRAMEAHAAVENELVAELSGQEQEQLARLLRRLLVAVDRSE